MKPYLNHTQVGGEFKPLFNPLAYSEVMEGRLFRMFVNGAKLRTWRNSSPHNWWLEAPSGTMLYHWPDGGRPEPIFQAMGTSVDCSNGEKVTYGGFMRGADEGLPRSQTWVYDKQKADELMFLWTRAGLCAASFNSLKGSTTLDTAALGKPALRLAHLLKRYAGVSMRPDDERAVSALCAMGLAEVQPRGYVVASDTLRRTALPREVHDDVRDLREPTKQFLRRFAAALQARGICKATSKGKVEEDGYPHYVRMSLDLEMLSGPAVTKQAQLKAFLFDRYYTHGDKEATNSGIEIGLYLPTDPEGRQVSVFARTLSVELVGRQHKAALQAAIAQLDSFDVANLVNQVDKNVPQQLR